MGERPSERKREGERRKGGREEGVIYSQLPCPQMKEGRRSERARETLSAWIDSDGGRGREERAAGGRGEKIRTSFLAWLPAWERERERENEQREANFLFNMLDWLAGSRS